MTTAAQIEVLPVGDAGGVVNILIVDDEPKNLTVLESVLDSPGYRLVRADSGAAALMALMAHEFAVLVLDVRMPDMSGFELAQMVKERRKTARIPIIFLTAYYSEDQHVLEGYGSGAVDYLHKPVNATVLRSKVAVFADLHRKERALEDANRALVAEVGERRRAEERLNELNKTLDRRVTDRTNALRVSDARLRKLNHRKDEFLATLAHELRNPLAPVGNAVQVLRRREATTPELKWAADLIDRQVRAMGRLIDDLMDVSRINQGRIELRPDLVQLADVLQDAIETSRPLVDEMGHRLVVAPLPVCCPLEADRTRLAQAFTNLLNNAAKYMDAGGRIQVDVTFDAHEVTVTVADSGIGIAADRLESVFELFSQEESALSRSRGGLGIGLSLTQRLVQLHGGRIRAASAGIGHGSQFMVTLPLAAEMPVQVPTEGPGEVAGVADAPVALRILVADDNVDAADTLAVLLELEGHRVMQVHDGEAAVAAIPQFQPHLVVLDIGMPKLNGYDACRRIRAHAEAFPTVVIALTGWGQPQDRKRSVEAGFDHHFVKPLNPDDLQGVLRAVAAGLRSPA